MKTEEDNQFALDTVSGTSLYVRDAKKRRYDKDSFMCMDRNCGKPVHPVGGDSDRKWHFRHYRVDGDESSAVACQGCGNLESREHLLAKHLLVKHNSHCRYVTNVCPQWRCTNRAYALGSQHMVAEVEIIVVGTKRKADVLLSEAVSKRQRFAIEVFHTHAVDFQKEEDLKAVNVGVLEVRASRVIQMLEKAEHDTRTVYFEVEYCGRELCDDCCMYTMRFGDMFPDYEQWERAWIWEGNRVQRIHHAHLVNNRALEQFVHDTCLQDVFPSYALWEEGWQRHGEESHKKLLLQIAHGRQKAETQRIVEQLNRQKAREQLIEDKWIVHDREQQIAMASEAKRRELDPVDVAGFHSLLRVMNMNF